MEVLILLALAAYALIRIDPRVLYAGDAVVIGEHRVVYLPHCRYDIAFPGHAAIYPGWLAEQGGAELSQYFGFRYVGAALLAAVAWVLFLVTRVIARRGGGKTMGLWRYVPLVGLVVIWNRYTFRLSDQVAVLAALLMALGLLTIRRTSLRAVAYAIALPACYLVAGAPCLLLGIMCGLAELLDRRRVILGIGYLVAAGAAPLLIGRGLFGVSLLEAYGRPTPLYHSSLEAVGSQTGTIEAVAWIGLYAFWCLIAIRQPLGRAAGHVARKLPGRLRGRLLRAAGLSIAIILGGAAIAASYDSCGGGLLRINRAAASGDWSAVLDEARRCPRRRYTLNVARDVNRALFETAQLGNLMFSYPQCPGTLLADFRNDEPYPNGPDTLLMLGAINQAEHAAFELLESRGPRPNVLGLLARLFTIKREPQTARIFLQALRRDPVHGSWADERLAELDDDPTDSEAEHVRAVMPPAPLLDLEAIEPSMLIHSPSLITFLPIFICFLA